MGNRKRINEILKMSKEDLYEYLRQENSSVQPTDNIEMKPFEQGIKIFYFHKDSDKPYKTRVYFTGEKDTDSLK